MACVYILYSLNLDKYYVGSCINFENRIVEHNTGVISGAFTTRASDWTLFHKIDHLDYQQARKIELHIKNMKSRKYFVDLKKYVEISEKLREKYRE